MLAIRSLYTITLANGEFASVAIKDAVLTDTIPNGLDIQYWLGYAEW